MRDRCGVLTHDSQRCSCVYISPLYPHFFSTYVVGTSPFSPFSSPRNLKRAFKLNGVICKNTRTIRKLHPGQEYHASPSSTIHFKTLIMSSSWNLRSPSCASSGKSAIALNFFCDVKRKEIVHKRTRKPTKLKICVHYPFHDP